MTLPRILVRASRLVAMAVIVGVGISTLVFAVTDWHLHDMEVYLDAARRIRAGDMLYGGDVDALSAYRYAPWFAYAWVPISHLPEPLIRIGWSAMLLAATFVALLPFARRPSWLLVALFGPILVGISAIGNVHAAMLALLVWGLPGRWGGVAVGIAASLKLVPILLALRFVAERRWGQLAVAVGVAVALWLPVLAFPIADVTFDPGLARTLPVPLWLTGGFAAIGASALLAVRRSRHTTLASAVAAVALLPRLFVYEISLVILGAVPPRTERSRDA